MRIFEGSFRKLIPYEETESRFRAVAECLRGGPAEVIDLQELAKARIDATLDLSVQEIGRRGLLSPADWELIMDIWSHLDRN